MMALDPTTSTSRVVVGSGRHGSYLHEAICGSPATSIPPPYPLPSLYYPAPVTSSHQVPMGQWRRPGRTSSKGVPHHVPHRP